MSEPNIDAMREAVRRDAARVFTRQELQQALMAFGSCWTCRAPRRSLVTEPEPGVFHMSMVCTADPEHDCTGD